MSKKYPIGLQDFEKIRKGNFLYLDKTMYIHRMVEQTGYFFLSRPRRFGKSLLIDTIQALYESKQSLFEGLFIANKWDWRKQNPVVRISFSNIGHKEKGLVKALQDSLDESAHKFNLSLKEEHISLKFKELIQKINSRLGKVVILIDEYDKSILDHLGKDDKQASDNLDTLKTFYSILKDADPYIELVLITGVTKFAKISIFSDLNNLIDLTMHTQFGGICGITQQELEENFEEELTQHDPNEVKRWYNGYTWDLKTEVYNPFSLFNFFMEGRFHNFWFESGTPSFLVNLMLDYGLYDTSFNEVDGQIISQFNIENLNPFSVLFQAGYVTLHDYDPIGNSYTLVSPNLEVKRSLDTLVLNSYRDNDKTGTLTILKKLNNCLKNNELHDLKELLNAIFAGLPYDLWESKREKTYQAIVHLVFTLLGLYVQSEVHTHKGRLDSVVTTSERVYIFEFKLDQTAQTALQQIQEKQYANAFKAQGKECIGIGVNIVQAKQEVDEVLWKIL